MVARILCARTHLSLPSPSLVIAPRDLIVKERLAWFAAVHGVSLSGD